MRIARSFSVALSLVVPGVCVAATVGSAEALEPSAVFVARPAFAAPPPLYVTRYYRAPPPPPIPQEPPIQGWLTLRGGVFDKDDVAKNDWTVGLKATGVLTPLLRAGMSADYSRREQSSAEVITTTVDGSGNPVEARVTTFQAESNLVPVMGLLEVHLPSPGFQPYFGAGGGWEFLNVREYDAARGVEFSSNYNGPGYQFFGGADLTFGKRMHLGGEIFYNGATVKREVIDIATGLLVEERINQNGFGFRGGLSFAF